MEFGTEMEVFTVNEKKEARYGGPCPYSQLLGRQKLGGSWFDTSPDKKLARLYQNK
jgi:hypothetical protein